MGEKDQEGATPPGGGRMNHDVMRRASELPIEGAAATDTLAASGGLELPGRVKRDAGDPHHDHPETIPGERDPQRPETKDQRPTHG